MMKQLPAINPNDEVVIVRVVVDDRSSVEGVIAQFRLNASNRASFAEASGARMSVAIAEHPVPPPIRPDMQSS